MAGARTRSGRRWLRPDRQLAHGFVKDAESIGLLLGPIPGGTVSDALEELVGMLSVMVTGGLTVEAAVSSIARLNPNAPVLEARLQYESQVGLIRAVADPAALMSEATKTYTWYAGPKQGDLFWPSVKEQLNKTLPEQAVTSVDTASSKVVSLLRPPGAVSFQSRGLVLGYVQSGKTTSFISVIAKAADAGYRVFIVLSGVTDNLRSQTQTRVDQVLVGDNEKSWMRLTTGESDFAHSSDNAAALLSQKGLRFIAVVKKNPARLRKLRDWLNAAGPAVLSGAPIMVIDDEADQASIDVSKGEGRASTINRLMKAILDKPKAAYVAYTATPFANLLIDPSNQKDLYPSDFIVPLPEPDGYFGAERMFGRAERLSEDEPLKDGLDVIRTISPEEASLLRPPKGKGAVHTWDPEVTESLRESVRWFILSTAARRVRAKGNPHATMLVHTSMLSEAHERLGKALERELDRVRDALEVKSVDEIERLRGLYEKEATRLRAADFGHEFVGFDEIDDQLLNVVSATRVVIDNYRSQDRLSYDDAAPTTAIVVGGNTLSRGLTLEGLSSSFFVRSASAYDTLLQMGRWFGYRAGYEELCRVWMTDELKKWFRDLSLVEAEIRQEMLRYELENVKPDQVAVRIRTHPSMAITAAAKMQKAVQASMSFSATRPQTILFPETEKQWLSDNLDAVRSLFESARVAGRVERTFPSGRRGFSALDAKDVLAFIDSYNFHPNARNLQRNLLSKYILNENSVNALLKWNVVIIENAKSGHKGLDLGLSSLIKPLERSKLKSSGDGPANLKAIASTIDRVADLDLDPAQVKIKARELGGSVTDASLQRIREMEMGDRGLICVYPINGRSKPEDDSDSSMREELNAEEDLIGLTFFFPTGRGPNSAVSYMSAGVDNEVFEDLDEEWEQMAAADELDDETLKVEEIHNG